MALRLDNPRTKECIECGARFESGYKKLTCSQECKRLRRIRQNRDWRIANPGYSRMKYLEFRAANPGYAREYMRQWHADNPGYAREWMEANRERANEATRRRRARLAGVATYLITERDLRRLLGRQGGVCAYCPSSILGGYEVDHVVPISKGGSNGIGNVVLSCESCNCSKSDWLLSEWRMRDVLTNPPQRKGIKPGGGRYGVAA